MSTKKVAKVIVFGVLPLVVLGVVGFVTGIGPYDLPSQSRKLEGVMAESKRLGLPMTAAELVGEIPPPETNAAIGVLRAIPEDLEFPNGLPAVVHPKLGSIKEAEDALAPFDKMLDELSATLRSKPDWYVERNWDLGPILRIPELGQFRSVAKFLLLRCTLRCAKGDVKDSLNDFVATRILSRHVAIEPLLLGPLISASIDGMSIRACEVLVDAWRQSPSILRELEQIVETTKSISDPRTALRGEFYMSLTECRNFDLFGGMDGLHAASGGYETKPVDPKRLQRDGLPIGMFERASLATIAEYWNAQIREFVRRGSAYRGWGQDLDTRAAMFRDDNRESEVLARVMMPIFANAESAMTRREAYQDIAVSFVRAFRIRAENGEWPKIALDTDDPFAPGKKFNASFSNFEVRIWSVGRNGKDDGGTVGVIRKDAHGDPIRCDDVAMVWPPTLRWDGVKQ